MIYAEIGTSYRVKDTCSSITFIPLVSLAFICSRKLNVNVRAPVETCLHITTYTKMTITKQPKKRERKKNTCALAQVESPWNPTRKEIERQKQRKWMRKMGWVSKKADWSERDGKHTRVYSIEQICTSSKQFAKGNGNLFNLSLFTVYYKYIYGTKGRIPLQGFQQIHRKGMGMRMRMKTHFVFYFFLSFIVLNRSIILRLAEEKEEIRSALKAEQEMYSSRCRVNQK